jgi:hypothetical protein
MWVGDLLATVVTSVTGDSIDEIGEICTPGDSVTQVNCSLIAAAKFSAIK